MPEIQAKLGQTTSTGRNAADRPNNDKAPPSTAIRANAPLLADLMDGLNKEGRSAYACAEAQALAKLLQAVNAPVNFADIEFNCPTDSGGLVLWVLCGNCSSWLTKKSGWGAGKKFKLADSVLTSLQPAAAPAATFNLKSMTDFPKLGK